MSQYVALLRGINVGGNNIISMADLKRCFQQAGFSNVTTYIQSGNVLFESEPEPPASLSTRIEQALGARFGYQARIVLRSQAEMQAVVDGAPAGFGTQPDQYRYDVLFVRDPLTPDEAIRNVKTREGVDSVAAGPGVCYFWRLSSRAGQSYLSRIVGLPMYQSLTIRNWNTTARLAALLDARAQA